MKDCAFTSHRIAFHESKGLHCYKLWPNLHANKGLCSCVSYQSPFTQGKFCPSTSHDTALDTNEGLLYQSYGSTSVIIINEGLCLEEF